MNAVGPSQAFQDVARELAAKRVAERDLDTLTLALPPITAAILNELGQRAEELAIRQPREGWAITKVADSAAISQNQDLYVRSLAAWYLARASNNWGQPKLVKSAISRARRGFLKLNEIGWTAACDWQFYVLAWTRPNFPVAVVTLEGALTQLARSGFEEFVPHCRMALSFAQLLIGKYKEAKENVDACEGMFTANGDQLNRARCWLSEASIYRREGHLENALRRASDSLTAFEETNASVDIAKTYYQLGLCHLMKADDLSTAMGQFNKAIEIYSALEMDLWKATGINNLGYTYLLSGSLDKAEKCYRQARKIFISHEAPGPLADNLNDHGKLNTARGLPVLSIEQFKRAKKLYESLGTELPAAITIANLGEAYGIIGRYQDALHHLEQATERFKSLNNFHRLGASEKFTALVWLQLGQLDEALIHLDKAAEYQGKTIQKALLPSIYYYRANIFFKQQDYAKAIDNLTMSLDAAIASGVRPQAALARRLLGEVLSHVERDFEASDYLQQAYADFTDMGMVMEQAATLVSLGMHYAHLAEEEKARAAFEDALRLSKEAMPEIQWKAHTGLAALAEMKGDTQAEIASYRHAIAAFTEIRENFWQPTLAASYVQTPSAIFDKAICRAAEMKSHSDALQFIEQHKATTLLLQLDAAGVLSRNKKTQDLVNLRSEITWLQNQVRASFEPTNRLKSVLESRRLSTQLTEKVRLYDSQMARLERQSDLSEGSTILSDSFNISVFRKLALDVVGRSWAALEFYLTDNELFTVVITSDHEQLYRAYISNRISMALEMNSINRQYTDLSQSDLSVLGSLLIPDSLSKSLTPDTYLFLVPHRKLHGIPWAAIQPSFTSQPLVSSCIPVVVPSLHSLGVLWKRRRPEPRLEHNNGLVIGLSSYNGRHEDLPQVNEELAIMTEQLGSQGKLLAGSDATWVNLVQLVRGSEQGRNKTDQAEFDWLHVATHFLADARTGRMSGMALWDGDVWLDELRDLAPLPELVTFSACNSIFSFVYEGDEHVDIPTTCFIAGADSVVGSSRRILDESALEFAKSFYKYYLGGSRPAEAVAQAQRSMIVQGYKVDSWASFACMGAL